jgi:hypothetical protein
VQTACCGPDAMTNPSLHETAQLLPSPAKFMHAPLAYPLATTGIDVQLTGSHMAPLLVHLPRLHVTVPWGVYPVLHCGVQSDPEITPDMHCDVHVPLATVGGAVVHGIGTHEIVVPFHTEAWHDAVPLGVYPVLHVTLHVPPLTTEPLHAHWPFAIVLVGAPLHAIGWHVGIVTYCANLHIASPVFWYPALHVSVQLLPSSTSLQLSKLPFAGSAGRVVQSLTVVRVHVTVVHVPNWHTALPLLT